MNHATFTLPLAFGEGNYTKKKTFCQQIIASRIYKKKECTNEFFFYAFLVASQFAQRSLRIDILFQSRRRSLTTIVLHIHVNVFADDEPTINFAFNWKHMLQLILYVILSMVLHFDKYYQGIIT